MGGCRFEWETLSYMNGTMVPGIFLVKMKMHQNVGRFPNGLFWVGRCMFFFSPFYHSSTQAVWNLFFESFPGKSAMKLRDNDHRFHESFDGVHCPWAMEFHSFEYDCPCDEFDM